MAGTIENWVCPNCDITVIDCLECSCKTRNVPHLQMIVHRIAEGFYIIWQTDDLKCYIHYQYEEYEVPYSFCTDKLSKLKVFL